jgi:hypothetical protein
MDIGRRSVIIGGGLATMATSWDLGIVRYPDARIKTLDPRFASLALGNAAIEVIATGCRFNEGPVWFGDLRCLVWSDIPNDRMMKWDEGHRQLGICISTESAMGSAIPGDTLNLSSHGDTGDIGPSGESPGAAGPEVCGGVVVSASRENVGDLVMGG